MVVIGLKVATCLQHGTDVRLHSAGSAAASQDDSLEVHPATQYAEQIGVDEREASPLTSLDSDAGEEEASLSESEEEPAADSQGFWEAEAIVRLRSSSASSLASPDARAR